MEPEEQERHPPADERAGHETSGSHETPVGEEGPPTETSTPSAQGDEPEAKVSETPLPQAEPGIYVGKQNAGEHALLGRIEEGQEYDYSQEKNPDVLEAIAAWVDAGMLEKKAEGLTPEAPDTESPRES